MHKNSIQQSGSKNSQFGKTWYYNPITNESKSFKSNTPIPIGWIKGRKLKKTNKTTQKYLENKQKYEMNPNLCEYCGAPISYDKRYVKSCCIEHGRLLNILHNKQTQSIRHSSGGKRHGAGRGKKGWYKGYFCDSSWELALVIYWLDHGIQFKRYNGYFEYQFQGKTKKYYPDFELTDGTIVEVKGYISNQWKAKLDAFPKDRKLLIFSKEQLLQVLEYVQDKYGKDFINLYE